MVYRGDLTNVNPIYEAGLAAIIPAKPKREIETFDGAYGERIGRIKLDL